MKYLLGVDFDNTLVSYDDLIYQKAVDEGLISSDTPKDKKVIRDSIRQKPDGDILWQKIQAFVYGKGMKKAKLIDGVKNFFDQCHAQKIDVRVVSHKTDFASMDEDETNLITSAISWMAENKFFSTEGLGLFAEDVFFEPTREEKIDRIKSLGCTHFIDDLQETFAESSFPKNVKKILYTPHNHSDVPADVQCCGSWNEISDCIFKNGN